MSSWTIAMGDWPHFDIEEAGPVFSYSNEAINGAFPTRLEALENVIRGFERTRRDLAEQLARAKRMRRRELSRLPTTPIEEA